MDINSDGNFVYHDEVPTIPPNRPSCRPHHRRSRGIVAPTSATFGSPIPANQRTDGQPVLDSGTKVINHNTTRRRKYNRKAKPSFLDPNNTDASDENDGKRLKPTALDEQNQTRQDTIGSSPPKPTADGGDNPQLQDEKLQVVASTYPDEDDLSGADERLLLHQNQEPQQSSDLGLFDQARKKGIIDFSSVAPSEAMFILDSPQEPKVAQIMRGDSLFTSKNETRCSVRPNSATRSSTKVKLRPLDLEDPEPIENDDPFDVSRLPPSRGQSPDASAVEMKKAHPQKLTHKTRKSTTKHKASATKSVPIPRRRSVKAKLESVVVNSGSSICGAEDGGLSEDNVNEQTMEVFAEFESDPSTKTRLDQQAMSHPTNFTLVTKAEAIPTSWSRKVADDGDYPQTTSAGYGIPSAREENNPKRSLSPEETRPQIYISKGQSPLAHFLEPTKDCQKNTLVKTVTAGVEKATKRPRIEEIASEVSLKRLPLNKNNRVPLYGIKNGTDDIFDARQSTELFKTTAFMERLRSIDLEDHIRDKSNKSAGILDSKDSPLELRKTQLGTLGPKRDIPQQFLADMATRGAALDQNTSLGSHKDIITKLNAHDLHHDGNTDHPQRGEVSYADDRERMFNEVSETHEKGLEDVMHKIVGVGSSLSLSFIITDQ